MGIGGVAIKRGVNTIFIIFIVTILNFVLFRIMPGDPITMITSVEIPVELRIVLLRQFGLDQPLYIQFIKYIEQLLRGNLGVSFIYQRPVTAIIFERLPATILLLLSSYLVTVLLSISMGLIAAWKRGGKTDLALITFGQVLNSMPIFWFGGLLLLYFAVHLKIVPLMGVTTLGLDHKTIFSHFSDVVYHLFLPMIALGVGNFGGLFLITRNSLLDVYTEDYITTAKAIGLSNRKILFHNALRNAMLPLFTVIMMRLGFIVGGAILTETIFTWPGIGQIIHSAVVYQDYPLLQGCFLFITISAVLANYISEMIYGYLDPRVRYE